jgi:hypothetical protein
VALIRHTYEILNSSHQSSTPNIRAYVSGAKCCGKNFLPVSNTIFGCHLLRKAKRSFGM